MKKYSEQVDIPKDKRYFHCLKHTIATHLLDAQADLMFIKDWLGHKNIQNTTIYSQLTADLIFIKDWLGHKNIQNTTIYSRLTNPAREEQARKVFASSRIV